MYERWLIGFHWIVWSERIWAKTSHRCRKTRKHFLGVSWSWFQTISNDFRKWIQVISNDFRLIILDDLRWFQMISEVPWMDFAPGGTSSPASAFASQSRPVRGRCPAGWDRYLCARTWCFRGVAQVQRCDKCEYVSRCGCTYINIYKYIYRYVWIKKIWKII